MTAPSPNARPDDDAPAAVTPAEKMPGQEPTLSTTLGQGLAAAAKRSAIGALADESVSTRHAMILALGGVRGLAETILPGLVFLLIYTFTKDVPLSLGASVVVAVVFTVIRLVGRTPVTQAVAGLVGVGASAVLALLTGRGEDNFVPGLLTNGAFSLALLLSIVVGWPLIGLVAGYLMDDGVAWRASRSRFRIMQLMTVVWLLLFAARLAVELPLYFAHDIEGLAIAKLLMGIPLYAPLLLVTWFVVRSVFGAGTGTNTDKNTATTAGEGAESEAHGTVEP